MKAEATKRKAHKEYMNEKTFNELMQSLCQALKYERGERTGFRVTKLSSSSEMRGKGRRDTG